VGQKYRLGGYPVMGGFPVKYAKPLVLKLRSKPFIVNDVNYSHGTKGLFTDGVAWVFGLNKPSLYVSSPMYQ
jgi:hypothetical protein